MKFREMYSKLIFCALICWISNAECLIRNMSRLHQDFPSITEGEPCVKGRMYRMACNTCHCVDNNALFCTKMACLGHGDMLRLKIHQQHKLRTLRADGQGNLTNISKNLRSEIKADKSKRDIPKAPKQGNELKKIKKASLGDPSPKHGVEMFKQDNSKVQGAGDEKNRSKKDILKNSALENTAKKIKEDSSRTGNEKKLKKVIRRQESDNPEEIIKKKNEKYLPTLPNGPCVPGKIYRQDCAKCYCNDGGKASCAAVSKTGCDDYPKPSDVLSPNDVIPPISNEVYWKLPILAHSAAVCKPGQMYMVTCNSCLCLDNGNLLCEQLLCVDQEEMNFSKAKKWSGASCKKGDVGLSTRCVRCQCVSGVTSCQPIPGCVEPNIMKLHGNSKTRMSLDTKKEKCDPGIVYRVDCNFCYCQPNQMLRCTRKSCLNFRQALMLKKQRSYLEKHGL